MRQLLSDLEIEFDTDANTPLTFDQLTPGRRAPVNWKCENGHSWPATVSNRLRGSACGFCTGKRLLKGYNDLQTKFPLIALQWDYECNENGPDDYLAHSNAVANWKCENGHCWRAKINNRTSGETECPMCTGTRPIKGVNDLSTLFPWLISEWDYEKNGDKDPSDYLPKSNAYIHWRCKRGHEWETKIYHRTDGSRCPYCMGLKAIQGETDLASLAPEIAQQWHPTKNHNHFPHEFTRYSHFEAYWICPEGHEYTSPIYRRSRGCGCSVCDNKTVVQGVNDLATFAPELADEWCIEENKGVLPTQVALHSNNRYAWKCRECGHVWRASPNNRFSGKGTGCPACHHHCVVPNLTSLWAMHPILAEEWDAGKNGKEANAVAAYDNRAYFWKCIHGHSWPASPANRMKGTSCPYCAGKLPVVGVNDLMTVCLHLGKEWHPTKNMGQVPADYLPQSHEPIWWQCENGHEWQAEIYARTRGSECPYCTGRLAIKGENDLKTTHPKLAEEWHPTKNIGKSPEDYMANSTEEIWWKCNKAHEWRKSICLRVGGSGCPECENRKNVKRRLI